MRIGFCTGFSEDRVRFAGEAGFDSIELFVGASPPLSLSKYNKREVEEARDFLSENGISAATVFHYEDYADRSAEKRKQAIANVSKAMDIADMLGTKVLCVNAWVPESEDEKGKLAYYKKTFSRFAKMAQDRGFKIAIENCPHGLKNLAWSPAMWQKMFSEVPSKAIGLEYDPSHLVWTGVDYISALEEFGSRVYAFHAKDTQVMHGIFAREGIYGSNWWRYRLPGYGDVDWRRIFVGLNDIGYRGDIAIEHEDPVFGGEKADEGLRLGLKHLRQFVPCPSR